LLVGYEDPFNVTMVVAIAASFSHASLRSALGQPLECIVTHP
jgi:hypothetical protein